jgi:hypothetical protein
MLSHSVFFTLKDSSEAACRSLVAQCDRWLRGHDGVRFYLAGTLAAQYDRPVNDRAFHVALQLVFESTAAHDAYQASARHQSFIAANQANWAQVRVFDAVSP